MKTLGIILAGGRSSRLFPATLGTSKQLLAVYDKPMIYYPLATLMLAGIQKFLIITTPGDQNAFIRIFSDTLGIDYFVAPQDKPRGIPDAFRIAEEYGYGGFDRYALILGDNLFYGATVTESLEMAYLSDQATVFLQRVNDPERFGVAVFDEEKELIDIEEKPQHPKSDIVVTGLYFYPNDVIEVAKTLKPSVRGETEITDLNKHYLKDGSLEYEVLKRGIFWSDVGTPDALLDASNFISGIQRNQNILICSPHEIAYNNGWILKDALLSAAKAYSNSEYGNKLRKIAHGDA